MADKVYNVPFLCTGNSARRIPAESILNRLGQGRFHHSGAALATVVGVLIEVPVMLLVVSVVNCSKGWHEHISHPIAVKP